MDRERVGLLVFGFVRELCNKNKTELLPDDIIKAFVLWLSFCDRFDEKFTHKDIEIESIQDDEYGEYQKIDIKKDCEGKFSSAICQQIVKQGDMQSWTFRFATVDMVVIGIVSEDIIQSSHKKYIRDFSDEHHGGYGLFVCSSLKYHASAHRSTNFQYGSQFDLKKNSMVTMELDMTQKENKNGILRYIFHAEPIDGADIGKYSNVLDDEINIEMSWRAAVSIYKSEKDATSLLPFQPK